MRDLWVNCSYPMRPVVVANSDTCQRHATSAVRVGARYHWRCEDHVGQVDADQVGPTVLEVEHS